MSRWASPHAGARKHRDGFAGSLGSVPDWRGLSALYLSLWQKLASAAAASVEQRRIFVLSPFIFIAGAVLYRILGFEPPVLLLGAGVLTIGALAIAKRHAPAASAWTALAIALWAGFCALPIHGALFGTPMLAGPKYGTYEMRIDSVLRDDGTQQRWLVSAIAAQDPRDDPNVRRARLVAPGGMAVGPGDLIQARIRFYPVPAPVLPGGYDAQFAGYYAGIGAYGAVLGEPVRLERGARGLYRAIEDLRTHITERLIAVLGARIGGIAMSLINGDQSRVTEEDWDTMALVGLAHVLSISGLHLTLVAGTMYVTLRVGLSLSHGAAQRWPIKKIAAGGGIAVAIAYMLISGLEVPAIRSTIMIILVFGAVIAGRQALTMRNVALAGLLLAALDPASLFRPSYQLSFAAVVALIAAFEMARKRREEGAVQKRSRAMALLVDATLTSLVAGAATLIFTAYHFQQTAPFGVVANVLSTPIISFIMMPAALFAMLLMPLGLEGPLLGVMGWSIEAMLAIAHFVGVISGGFDPSPILSPSALIISLIALAWFAFFQTRIRLAGPILAIPVIFLFCREPAPDILIADTTQAVAARDHGQLALVTGRINTFATNVWSERYMETIEGRNDNTECDSQGCILKTSHGYTVAVIRDRAAFLDDCPTADLVVARINAPQWCKHITTVIDVGDLARSGAHMLYWRPQTETFAIKPSVTDTDRPWRGGL